MTDKIPEGWRECKLGDAIELLYGKGLKESDRKQGDIPVYGSNGIVGYHNDHLVKGPGIIIGRKGSVGEIKYSKRDFFPIDTTYYVVTKDGNDMKFLYYYLLTLQLNTMNSHSAVPGLNRDNVYSLDVLLPPLSEQKAIASVLGSLDDKIDLLHKENQTLEKLAETIFRQWFIEEADDSWEVGRLGDFLSLIESGRRPKGGIDTDLMSGIPSIGAENINGLGRYDYSKTRFVSKDFFKSIKKGIIQDYDVLIYKDGAYVGRKSMFGRNYPYDICTVNEHVFILRSNDKLNQFFLYFLLQEEDLAQLNSNSAQPGLNQNAMKSFEIIVPPKRLTDEFGNIVKSLIDKIFFNGRQIRTLENLRDTLLPKLMSGEVRLELGETE